MTVPSLDPVDRVRARLAEHGAGSSPGEVARALRADGGLTSDAVVLDVFHTLRSESTGAGPLDPLLASPRSHGHPRQRTTRGVRRHRCRADPQRRDLPRRRVRTTPRATSRRHRRASPRRRLPLCRRTDAGRHTLPRRSRPDRAIRHLPVTAGAGPSAADARRAGRERHRPCASGAPAGRPRRLPARCRDHRRHGEWQDDSVERLAVDGRPERAHRPRRGRGRAASSTPARGRSRGTTSQRRGRRRDRAPDPGATEPADASRPPRRRRGSRRGGRRPAGGDEHRSRRILQHGARQLRARPACAVRGAGGGRGPAT